jgi:hypothetical protein
MPAHYLNANTVDPDMDTIVEPNNVLEAARFLNGYNV